MSTAVGDKSSLKPRCHFEPRCLVAAGSKQTETLTVHRFHNAKPLVPAPADRRQRLTQTPNPQHPAPSTQHPAPSTQHPAPSTQHPAPSTQHPAPSTQHPAPPRVDHNKPRDGLHSSAASPVLCGTSARAKAPITGSAETEGIGGGTARDVKGSTSVLLLEPGSAAVPECSSCLVARQILVPNAQQLVGPQAPPPLGLLQWGPFSPFGNL
ncbi:uncharacterized protein VDAG_03431 [Verticillium dahliae VdLs.17]|uniref:Uncharacterized protein n=1 Tax=Verticillium dahliae (strain VdLs.17 / ATCC MYA-4575 / FGSC 10137) TaxID=498257 RepID=G2WZI9_VERDV|nr:uncharacterized protein VDAG_03431 [Verticillium dahliae VdLs.17]EGY21991.1 hypothetical protein VDAG_03431 [Verticillium dahliae VdLs.17]